jgi:hypothetical protein
MVPPDSFGLDLEYRQIVDAALRTTAAALQPINVSSSERPCLALHLFVELSEFLEGFAIHRRLRAKRERLSAIQTARPGTTGIPARPAGTRQARRGFARRADGKRRE